MKLTTTTTFDESKYEVIGIVESVTTRAISDFRQVFAQILGTFGGKNDVLNTKFMKARDDALAALKDKAEGMGADLVIGVSLTTDVVNMSGTEFITYAGLGTALRRKGSSQGGGGKKRRTFRKLPKA
jgi:uncharacterized protein YbjQ (UPF0145 family)